MIRIVSLFSFAITSRIGNPIRIDRSVVDFFNIGRLKKIEQTLIGFFH